MRFFMQQDLFTIIPNEAWLDSRLNKTDLRVLGAILSYRAKNTDTVWPSRDQISSRTGLHISNISKSTTRLADLGWLKKDGRGGFSKATRYLITVPDLATVVESTTVAEPATRRVAEPATFTVAEPATRIEQTKEQTNRTDQDIDTRARKKKTKQPNFDAWPEPPDTEQWAAILANRKRKKAGNTQRAIDRLGAKLHVAVNHGYAFSECMDTWEDRGWSGFDVGWMQNKGNQPTNPTTPTNKQTGEPGYYEKNRGDFTDDRVDPFWTDGL